MIHFPKKGSKVYLTITLLLVFVFALSGFSSQTLAAPSTGQAISTEIADITETASPKVVWITTTYQSRGTVITPFGEMDTTPSEGLGSGFFFEDQGYILTNAHVVQGAETIEVTLKDQKTPLPAKLIGIDQELDVAIIKIETSDKIQPLKLGDSDKARIGEWVIAIGNPYGLDHTVTMGIISAKGRPISTGGNNAGNYDNMIQTDAAINPGNSGGPLLNLRGEVIGINTAVSSTGQGLGFAIPINTVKEILNELKTKGKISHPWIGVGLNDIRAVDPRTKSYLGLDKNEGVVITTVYRNSPASKAGLKRWDLILEMDRQPVSGLEDFLKMVRQHKVGDKVTLMIQRNENLTTVEVVLEEKPSTTN
ncbi:MAG TPA: trypsin-like peptidase domain-containing protein [Bacillota bacterium]|nr:trypsin-like peptidase domain-containing protein [Bacillota bacterium]